MFSKPFPEIDVAALAEKLKSDDDFILLDVREPVELQQAKIDDARVINAPLSKLAEAGTSALPEPLQGKERSVLVMCHHGSRSADVTQWLIQNGWTNVVNVRGGIDAYARKIDASVGMY